MTDAEVKALKPGDVVRLYVSATYRGIQLGTHHTFTVKSILRREESKAAPAVGHYWVTVLGHETGDKQWAIESDEYLRAFGYQTHTLKMVPSTQPFTLPSSVPERVLGAEKC